LLTHGVTCKHVWSDLCAGCGAELEGEPKTSPYTGFYVCEECYNEEVSDADPEWMLDPPLNVWDE
jgi:hypothetical protein